MGFAVHVFPRLVGCDGRLRSRGQAEVLDVRVGHACSSLQRLRRAEATIDSGKEGGPGGTAITRRVHAVGNDVCKLSEVARVLLGRGPRAEAEAGHERRSVSVPPILRRAVQIREEEASFAVPGTSELHPAPPPLSRPRLSPPPSFLLLLLVLPFF